MLRDLCNFVNLILIELPRTLPQERAALSPSASSRPQLHRENVSRERPPPVDLLKKHALMESRSS